MANILSLEIYFFNDEVVTLVGLKIPEQLDYL